MDMKKSLSNADVRKIINATIIIILIIVIYFGTRPPAIVVNESYIRISGMYGLEFLVKDVSELELREALPRTLNRTNGMDLFGMARRGIYHLEELGRTRMFSFSKGGPFILMKVGNEWIVINYRTASETEALYEQLDDVINGSNYR